MIEPNVFNAHEAAPFKAIVSTPSPPSTTSLTVKPDVKLIVSLPEPPINETFSSVVAPNDEPPVLAEASIVPVITAPTAAPAKSIAVVTVSF